VLHEAEAAYPASIAVRLGIEFCRAFSQHEWPRIAALFAADIAHVDHRLAAFGETRGADVAIERLSSVDQVMPEAVAEVRRVVFAEEQVALAEVAVVEGEHAIVFLLLLHCAGERIARYEVFDLADEANAVARATELAGQATLR
jgi:hypothetical protein